MAPTTRRAVAANAKKPPTRKQSIHKAGQPKSASAKQSTYEHAMDIDEPETDDAEDEPDSRALVSTDAAQSSLQVAFNPLRDMADKIGQEVEKFAITLDLYLQDLSKSGNRYAAAQDVVSDFKNIAQGAVDDLKARHEKQRARQLREEWRSQAQLSTATDVPAHRESVLDKTRSLLSLDRGSAEELRAWQEEADLWELVRIVLEVYYRPTYDKEGLQREREQLLSTLEETNRYTTEFDLWQRFLVEDSVANERALMKRWLEEAVDHQQSDILGITEELESRATTGKALWSNGWMHTREKIKAEKRIRSWPSASDSIQPQIRRSDNNELLVTQLDPDALTKHERALEKGDGYFERATWIACWEMLRRGRSWDEVKAWCEERNEGWRAMAMGKAGGPGQTTSAATWRRMCQAGATAGGFNDYEVAVYGLLGGVADPVLKVAKSIDDHLYAHYSALLLQQFDHWRRSRTQNADDEHRETNLIAYGNTLQDPDHAQQAIVELVIRLRSKQETRSEAARPVKVVQSYLMANEVEAMIHTVGVAIGEADRANGRREHLILRSPTEIHAEDISSETEVALDARTMRIVSHIAIVLASLRSEPLLDIERGIEENSIISYIQQLRVAKKRDLIPLYASRLSNARNIITMADVLKDIMEPREQEEVMRLMSQYYHFDVDQIFWEQTLDLTEKTLGLEEPKSRPVTILEATDQKEYPGQRIIADFLPESLTDGDVVIVNSLQWFMLLPAHWKMTFEALSLTVRKCLVVGRFACALEIVRTYPFETVSMQKTYQTLGSSFNIFEEGLAPPEGDAEAFAWVTMQQESRAYFELEQLVRIVESLALWAREERPYVSRRPTPSSVPASVKHAKQVLVEAIQPLLNGLLVEARDESEADDFAHIRRAYVPEIIIAYNSALYTAGNILTRDALIESMDLSVAVAKDENGIAASIVQAGRMRELVESFARSSKAMLLLKAQSTKQWKPRKDKEGKDPGIWEIGPQGSMGANTAIVRQAIRS